MSDAVVTAPVVEGLKPGWKTTEFWLAFGAQLVSLVLMLGLPEDKPMMKVAAVAGSVLVALGYQVSRGLVKDGTKPGIKSTEFLLTAANTAVSVIAVSGIVKDPSQMLQMAGFITGALGAGGYSLSRGLAKKE